MIVATVTVFSRIRSMHLTETSPSKDLEQLCKYIRKGIRVPISPKLEDGTVSEKFTDALKEGGVLKAMSQPHGKMGNFVMKVNES